MCEQPGMVGKHTLDQMILGKPDYLDLLETSAS